MCWGGPGTFPASLLQWPPPPTHRHHVPDHLCVLSTVTAPAGDRRGCFSLPPGFSLCSSYLSSSILLRGFPRGQLIKNLPAVQETWVNPWVGKISWRRDRLTTPVFWPGEFHGLVPEVAKSRTRLSDFHFHILPPEMWDKDHYSILQ